MQREDRDFYQRARLDKQNMVPSLEWTGEALYDLANARIRSCGVDGQQPTLRSLLDDSITDERLIDAFRSLRVPRHLFKFLYRLLVAHCNAHTDEQPRVADPPRNVRSHARRLQPRPGRRRPRPASRLKVADTLRLPSLWRFKVGQ